jgi:hypothetical protein
MVEIVEVLCLWESSLGLGDFYDVDNIQKFCVKDTANLIDLKNDGYESWY